jgi:SAM-dependent methyltransferase
MNLTLRSLAREVVKGPIGQVLFFGNARFCPICQSNLRSFLPYGYPRRLDVRCPICDSVERHRLIWLFFQKKTNLFDANKKKMLHIAPERCLATRLSGMQSMEYLSADICNPAAMVKMDITNIQYPDNTFDVIYCSHILEHILDDRKAMREFYRVLTNEGWAVLQVPIMLETTYEDPAIIDPTERAKAFGQSDHVRCYGQDYEQRLIDAGFNVKRIKVTEVVKQKEIERMRIDEKEDIFFCTKL